MKLEKRTLVVVALALVGLVLTYYLATGVIPRVMVTLTKAAPAKTISFGKSLVLGEKLLARADGKDECIVNVFILDESEKGVVSKRVVLSSTETVVKIDPETGVTNNDGKASFKMVSSKEGQYELKAAVEGIDLGKGMKVTFRN